MSKAVLSSKGPRRALAVTLMIGGASMLPLPAGGLAAQQWQGVEAGAELRDAVRRLASDPKNVDALLEAGDAALAMDDADAAAGFYLRAEAVDPGNSRIKVALGRARLRQEDPVMAIALFNQAATLGEPVASFAADRGLAYDLVGDTRSAQQSYELARRTDASQALTIRLAVSYDLSGQRTESAKLLNPLLNASDNQAWRAQAFLHAAHGEIDKARAVAKSFLGASRAAQLDSYLSKMDELTVAQQMAAIHFGHFPRGNYGVDSAVVAAMQKQLGVGSAPAPAKAAGKARDPQFIDFRGSKQKNVSYQPPRRPVAVAVAPAPPPNAVSSQQPPSSPSDALAEAGRNAAAPSVTAAPPSAVAAVEQPAPAFTPSPPAPVPMSQPEPMALPAQPVASPAPVAQPQPAPVTAVSAAPVFTAPSAAPTPTLAPVAASGEDLQQPPPAAPPPAERNLAALISGIEIPESERQQDVVPVTADMVDLAANPSRNWVQIATGSNLNALGFDYRKFARANEALFEGRKGWTSEWGMTRRLVVGPFDTLSAAKQWDQDFREAGGDSFVWQSDNGTVVEPLGNR